MHLTLDSLKSDTEIKICAQAAYWEGYENILGCGKVKQGGKSSSIGYVIKHLDTVSYPGQGLKKLEYLNTSSSHIDNDS